MGRSRRRTRARRTRRARLRRARTRSARLLAGIGLDGRRTRLLLVALAAYVLCVNALVRTLGGGDPALLSPLYLGDKSRALAHLAWHTCLHPFRPEDADGATAVRRAAKRHGVDPALALAVARAESSLRPHAISRTGAMGLMQLMPDTAADLGVADPFDPEQNADGAVRYLRALLSRYRGSIPSALSAYNAGPGNVPRNAVGRVPQATRGYVRTVLGSL